MLWVNGYLSYKPQQSTCICFLHFWYQRTYNFCGINVSNYGSLLCTLCLSNQTSKCVTYLSRTFITYSKWCTSFWHFPWINYCIQTFEEDRPVPKIPRKYSISEKQLFFVPTEEANDNEEKQKNQEGYKVKDHGPCHGSGGSICCGALHHKKSQRT